MPADRNSGSGNPTGSKPKKNKAKQEKNELDNAVMDGIIFKPTKQPGLRSREKSMDPKSPGNRIVQERMAQCAKAKEEKKKKET
ncbi:uncharacterized protein Bfra_001882 [Botrytis fragariae]|uniref:Uncharacterized protein n=1 Tax=Botrytis fragariae TaxID=1964551 RepID=A0A8H6EMN9_9HELO|nr:uncharacterized protein Bfra_001882 [Botrytis fragariae]KAF5877515.1 hypothetical protein Bfra_001882 [Botrytis fragariae]